MTVFRPDTPEQTAEAVRWALSSEAPLEILGQGSKRGLGRPAEAEHGLDLSGLSGVIAYEPEELILTARAGTPMAEILPLLAGRRQQLAFEAPDYGPLYGEPAGRGTLGGLIAAGLAGPRRIKDGAARDHTLGLEAVNGRGELYRCGAKVVKNVTGYDVPKLLAGSFGTLSVLTEVTVKVLPAPETAATLVLSGRDDPRGVAALGAALRSPYEVSGAVHLPAPVTARSAVARVAGAGTALTLVRVEGFGPSVGARVAALKEELGCDGVLDVGETVLLWAELRDVVCFLQPDTLLWKLSVAPAEAARVAEAIRAAATADLFYDWGGGLLWVSVPDAASAPAIRAAVGSGHATLVRAPDTVRTAVGAFHPPAEPVLALSRRVKAAFDPRGLFNPGRMYAGV